MENSQNVMVTIRCLVYNHEPYVRQCLEGFVMQKTNFRFEAIVHDDASTDGTVAIILEYAEKYPNIIKPIFQKENQYKKNFEVIRQVMDEHTQGKYIALCEGDDYWTDPYKLQKQVDFLEANSEYSMCFANAIEHWEDGTKEDKCFSNVEDRDYTGIEIYKKWTIPTASVLCRREIIFSERYKEITANKNFIFGDTILALTCCEFGKIRGMSDVVSVYRKHVGGMIFSWDDKKIIKFIRHNEAILSEFGIKYKKGANLHISISAARMMFRTIKKKDYRDFFHYFIFFIKTMSCKTFLFFYKLLLNKISI